VRRALGVVLLGLLFALPAAGSTPGAHILFEQAHGSPTDLVLVDADATNLVNLTPGDQTFYVSDGEGSWSPDGSRVVFTSRRDSNVSTEIYVMNADGSNQQRLTHDGPEGVQNTSAEAFDTNPVWSPDGSRIAYLKWVRGAIDVWVMRPDGSGQRPVTADGGMKSQLAWAPDGARLTYEITGTIFVVPAAGGSPVTVARGIGLTWSPDGTRLAYGNSDGLFVAGPNGGDPRRIFTMSAQSPSWSPDGSRIAFVATRIYPELASKVGVPSRQDVYTVRPDGSDLRRLTGPRDIETPTQFPGAGFVPTWWPDGSRLFFQSQRSSADEMNADGTCEGPFAATPISLSRPKWRPGSLPGLGAIRCADLRVTPKRTGGYAGPAALGQESPFEFEIDNDGNETATAVSVELKTTANIEILDGNAGVFPCSGGPRDLVCSLPPVSPASVLTVKFRVRSSAAGIFPFSLSVDALEPDTDTFTNTVNLSTSVLPCDQVGTYGDDVLVGTPKRDRICALPGADRVSGGGGDDYLDSGNGNDIVVGGPGRDEILAKGGHDTIYARDGRRDVIDCGNERDVAVVDRLDVVRHCETVVRPRGSRRVP
jgi:Tol biopolymer transport system component